MPRRTPLSTTRIRLTQNVVGAGNALPGAIVPAHYSGVVETPVFWAERPNDLVGMGRRPQRCPSQIDRWSGSGSVSTSGVVSKRIVVRCRVSYAGQPGFPLVAKETHA